VINVAEDYHVTNSILDAGVKSLLHTEIKHDFRSMVSACVHRLEKHHAMVAAGKMPQSREQPRCWVTEQIKKPGPHPWIWNAHDANMALVSP
jgi:hypothetical protein